MPGAPVAEADRRKLKEQIRKPLASLPFEERRVMVDQGKKMISAIHATLAQDGGAIAGRWRAVHMPGYDHRPTHLEMDGRVLLIRGSWADKAGLVHGMYTDEWVAAGEEPFCRCSYVYYYALRELPADMLTDEGARRMAKARELVA